MNSLYNPGVYAKVYAQSMRIPLQSTHHCRAVYLHLTPSLRVPVILSTHTCASPACQVMPARSQSPIPPSTRTTLYHVSAGCLPDHNPIAMTDRLRYAGQVKTLTPQATRRRAIQALVEHGQERMCLSAGRSLAERGRLKNTPGSVRICAIITYYRAFSSVRKLCERSEDGRESLEPKISRSRIVCTLYINI